MRVGRACRIFVIIKTSHTILYIPRVTFVGDVNAKCINADTKVSGPQECSCDTNEKTCSVLIPYYSAYMERSATKRGCIFNMFGFLTESKSGVLNPTGGILL